MKAAVTGGTGFVGGVLLRLLVPRAQEVRVLVRWPADDDRMRALGAKPVRGDLTVPGGCDGLVRGGDVVFHSAARVDMVGRWADFRETTIEGTRRLLAAALPCKPQRFVYISSGAVYSPKHAQGGMSAERTPTRPAKYDLYGRAKLEAENLVRTECGRAECPWTIMRLGFLYGPGNRALLRHFVPMLERGRLAVIGDGTNRIATLHVDDAARAVLLAGTHTSVVDKIYDVASDEPVTQREFLDATADALGLPRCRRQVGRRFAGLVGLLADAAARIPGCQPSLTRAMITLMSTDQVLDAGRIRRELGWKAEVRFADGMRQMREWYEQHRAELKVEGTR